MAFPYAEDPIHLGMDRVRRSTSEERNRKIDQQADNSIARYSRTGPGKSASALPIWTGSGMSSAYWGGRIHPGAQRPRAGKSTVKNTHCRMRCKAPDAFVVLSIGATHDLSPII